MRFLETDDFNSALEQGKSPAAISAITMTVAQTDGVKNVDSSEEFEQAPAPKAKAAPADDAPVEREDATPEPTKRASKKDEAPAAKKDVSKILAEWDDE